MRNPDSTHGAALLTDLYQLTMACGYWRQGTAETDAAFHLHFRRHPFHGGFTIAAGLGPVVAFLEQFRFTDDDVAFLATLTGNDGRALFDRGFLAYLRELRFTCDVDAIPEGTAVFPQEPLLRVCGPILQCQLVESVLLNIVNFQSLIATKAARIHLAAGGQPVLEFGLRRAQGTDGALAASRAAYVGGCDATSNVLAGKVHGIPVRGTHAHSWVMSFEDEATAFQAYADALPNNCIFLVDTYDTIRGVHQAVAAGRRLRAAGHEMVGIRLDSGDLASLSKEARRILDEGGFPDACIVASNDLDEHSIARLRAAGAPISVWGVGTRLVTGHDQAALGGVYKLSAIRGPDGTWKPRVKLSEQPAKTSNPGRQQVRRYQDRTGFLADIIYDIGEGLPDEVVGVGIADPERRFEVGVETFGVDLLAPVFRRGRKVGESPALADIRQRTLRQLQQLPAGCRRLEQPDIYVVGLEAGLHEMKRTVAAQAGRSA